jgi:hypothetical protein
MPFFFPINSDQARQLFVRDSASGLQAALTLQSFIVTGSTAATVVFAEEIVSTAAASHVEQQSPRQSARHDIVTGIQQAGRQARQP